MLRKLLFHRTPDAAEGGGGNDRYMEAIDKLGKKHTKEIEAVKSEQDKAVAAVKAQLEKQFEEDLLKAKNEAADAKKTAEDLEKKMGTMQFQVGEPRIKTFFAELGEKLTEHKADLGKKTPFNFSMDRKAVGDMSSANTTGNYFISPDTRPGIVLRPYEEVHMRNLLPTGSTTSDTIRHVRDMGGEGGPDMVAPAAQKPQMDRDLEIFDANVRKIAVWLRVPEEMIEDIPYLQSFLTNIGVEEMLLVEDQQILYGDGTGQNLSGLFTNAVSFTAGTSVIAAPNRFDALRAARKQMRLSRRRPTFYLVSPDDYFMMTSAKDTTNNYILMGGGNGIIPNLDGVLLVEHTEIADNDFLAGDRRAAEIVFRSNIRTNFYEQDRDNAIKNLVTIVIEERLALPIYYENGFVKGTFTGTGGAIPDLTS